MKQQQILVIGLGRFGQSLALTLAEGGAEVMGIDSREDAADGVSAELTHVLIADTTEEKVLDEIGIDQFDVVVCAIGGDMQASIMTTLLLKEKGAKKLVAKASTALHGRALAKIGVDRVVFPEREMAIWLAKDFLTPHINTVLNLTVRESMFEMPAAEQFVGKTLQALQLRHRFGLNVLAVRRNGDTIVSPTADEIIVEGDVLLVLGNQQAAEAALHQ